MDDSTTNQQQEDGININSLLMTNRKKNSSDSTRYNQQNILDYEEEEYDDINNNDIGNNLSTNRKKHDCETFGIEKIIQNIARSENNKKKKTIKKKTTKIKSSKKKFKSCSTLNDDINSGEVKHHSQKEVSEQTNFNILKDFQINRNFITRKTQNFNIDKIIFKNMKEKRNSFALFSSPQFQNSKSTLPNSKIDYKNKSKIYKIKNKDALSSYPKKFVCKKKYSNLMTHINTDSNLIANYNCKNYPKINEKLLYEKNGNILNSQTIETDKINNILVKSCIKHPMINQMKDFKSLRKLHFKSSEMFYNAILKKQKFMENQTKLLNNIMKKYNDFLRLSHQKRSAECIIKKPNVLRNLYTKTDNDNKNFYCIEFNNIIFKARQMSEEMKQKQISFENKQKDYLKKASTFKDFLKYGNIYS